MTRRTDTQDTQERMVQNWNPKLSEGAAILARQVGPLARMADGWSDGVRDISPVSERADYESGWLMGAQAVEDNSE